MPSSNRIDYLDLLRVAAAVAVIIIHVIGPYRALFGEIPNSEWVTAIVFNNISRWAVPVFILITGALLLSDTRPWDTKNYIKRRVGKVLIPFLAWSIFYAFLTGVSTSGWNSEAAMETLQALPSHQTYYHLGFFYYFLPLYLVIPFLRPLVQRIPLWAVGTLVAAWLVLTLLYLMFVKGIWNHQLILYSGYLLAGFWLFKIGQKKDAEFYANPQLKPQLGWRWLIIIFGVVGLIATNLYILETSFAADKYKFGRWLSYKTLNTALVAMMIFTIAQTWGAYWLSQGSQSLKKAIAFISRHSLGIYLMHPIILWPVRAFDWYPMPAIIMIPLWTFIAGAGALAMSYGLSKNKKTAWLVP